MTERKLAEEVLKKREEESGDRSLKLEEANTALTEVPLQHREEDRKTLKNTILSIIREMVFPDPEKLKQSHLTENQSSSSGHTRIESR